MSQHDDNITFDLCSDDRHMLDRLVETGFDIEALGPLSDVERRRANQLLRMLGLMNDYPVADADESLIHVTMARIDQHDRELAQGLKLAGTAAAESQPERSHGNLAFLREWRLPDFLTVAASLLIITSLTMHLLSPDASSPTTPENIAGLDVSMPSVSTPSNTAGIGDLASFLPVFGTASPDDASGVPADEVGAWMVFSPAGVRVLTASRADVEANLADEEFALPIAAIRVIDGPDAKGVQGLLRHDEDPIQLSDDAILRWQETGSPWEAQAVPYIGRELIDPFPVY